MLAGLELDSKFSKKLDLYWDSFVSALPDAFSNDNALARSILYGVKLAGREKGHMTYEELTVKFQLFEMVMHLVTMVTPRKFVQIFPIEKRYDGKRWDTKDYFYTVEMINEHGWDEPIGVTTEEVFEFLWDYQNWDVMIFLVEYMGLMSDIRRAQGQPGIMEQWAAENGIRTYTMHSTSDGKQYVVDENGRSMPIKKKRPKHLKLVVPKRGSVH